MDEITKSFFEEGMIFGTVMMLKLETNHTDEEILEIIMDEYDLPEYAARTFVYPKKPVDWKGEAEKLGRSLRERLDRQKREQEEKEKKMIEMGR